MTNINQLNEITQATGTQAQTKPKTGESSNGFDSLLSSALEKTEAAEGGTKSMGLEEISAPGFELEAPSSIVTGKIDKLLGLLDNYVNQLDNPEISLKSIEPALERINADATELLEEARFLGDEDSQLKEIATQTVVAAKTEHLKFQRGDYLS